MVKSNDLMMIAIAAGAVYLLSKNASAERDTSSAATGYTAPQEKPQTFYLSPSTTTSPSGPQNIPSGTSGQSNTVSDAKSVTFKTVQEGVNALNQAWASGQTIKTSGGVLWSNPQNKNDKILQLSTGDVKRVTVRTVR